MNSKPRNLAFAGVGATAVLLVFAGWLFDRNLRSLAEADRSIDHTNRVLLELDKVLVSLVDAETGERGFAITGDEQYLQPYYEAADRFHRQLDQLAQLTAGQPSQRARIGELRQLAQSALDEMERVIGAVKASPEPTTGRDELLKGGGKQKMDAVRELVSQIRDSERKLLSQRVETSAAGYDSALKTNYLVISLAVALAVAVLYLVYRYSILQAETTSAILRERELFRITLASIGDAVITTDVRGRVAFLNSIAERLTGWTTNEALGQPLEEVFHIINEKTRKRAETPCERVLREGIVVGLANHTVLIPKNGQEMPIDDSAAPIRDRDGTILGVVLVFRDATEQRRAADARERLAAIVHDSQDAIIGQDLDGVITSWNRGAEELFGYTAEEAIGRTLELIIPPDRRHEFSEAVEKLRRGEHVEYFDTVRVCKDGSLLDVSSQISPIRNPEGEVVGASKLAHDISHRKRTEETLRFLADSSAALAALVDYESTMQKVARLAVPFMADWCIVDMIDANGQIRRVAYAHRDENAEATLKQYVEQYPLDWNSPGLSVEAIRTGKPEVVASFSLELMNRIAREPEKRALLDALAPRSCIAVPVVIRSQAVGSLLFVTSGSGRHYTRTDVEVAMELAKRAAIAVENAQLYRDLKEAQRQKDDFLAMLAHELRNPLAAIQYANEVGKLTDTDHEAATDVIDRQVKTLSHLVDDLLDVSRITRDKIQLRKEQIDGGALMRRAIAIAQPAIEARHHTLVVDVSEEPMPLFVDPVRIEQVLTNLLSNATKYTAEGGQITVRAYPQDDRVIFKVRDTGIGIPTEMLPRVFELFTQVERSLARSEGGLGIGLTVVRRLAEMHGGSVSATSEGIGKGSEFTVRLPTSATRPPVVHEREVPVAQPRSLRILVVEDNVDSANSLVKLLNKSGHTTAVAYDGPAALAAAHTFRPEVILMDLGLPGYDGYQIAHQLRQEADFQRVHMIAISGYAQSDDRRRSREAGFDAHLVKPVNFVDLTALLASISPNS